MEHKWTEMRPFGKTLRLPKAAFGASADGAIWIIPFHVSWRSGTMSRSAEATACVSETIEFSPIRARSIQDAVAICPLLLQMKTYDTVVESRSGRPDLLLRRGQL